MATFCTKCGASIPDGNQFCTACGTPVSAMGAAPPAATGAGATPPAWTPVVTPQGGPSASPGWTTTPAPVYAQPVQPRSGGAVKVILIIVGVFVGLGILSAALVMFGLWRVSRHVHMSNDGGVKISTPQGTLSASSGENGTVKITTPGGTLMTGNAAKVSAADLGIDIYPGATRHEGGMQITTPKGSTVSAVFSTDDSLDKVVGFYKDKMGQGISVYQNDQGAVLSMNSADNKSSIVVTISTSPTATDGHTKIAIMHARST